MAIAAGEMPLLQRPHSIPKVLWDIVKSCWLLIPEERPSAQRLRDEFRKLCIVDEAEWVIVYLPQGSC